MKKVISSFLVFVVLLVTFPLASLAASPSFKVTITAPEAYKAGDVIDVTVTVSDVSVSGGISFLNFDLHYDNALLSVNYESAALSAMEPFYYWDDLTRINGTWNSDGSFVAANDGVIEFFAGDIGSDDGEQWHNLVDGETLVFKFSFTALDDASADANFWINGENSACGAYTDDASNPVGYVEYAGLDESATVTKTVLYSENAAEGGHIAGSAATCTEPQVCTGCGTVLQTATGHEYDSVVTAPDCTEQGYTTHTCTACGDVVIDSYVDATGHEYDSVVTAPDCTEQGYTTHTCTTCGDVVIDSYVDASGHEYDSVVTAPDCTEQGYTTHTCTACGDIVIDSYVDATGHEYDSVVTAPDCTEQGYTTHTCTTCGDVVIDSYVDATGHEYDSVVTAPDCTEQGYTTHTCTACGDIVIDSYVDATGHDDGEWKVITEATYETAGEEGRYCTQCGELLETRTVSKKYHRGDVNADGRINVVDYTLLKRYILGVATFDNLKEGAEARADINGDGRHNTVDYMMLKRAVLGQYTIVD